MARMKKAYRELTVSEATNYGKRTAPMLRIQGLWLEELGFKTGDPVLVKCEDGKLIITLDEAREEMMVAEQAFYEAENKKLQELQDKLKAKRCALHAKLVAERKEKYNGVEVGMVAECVAE